ncbi:ATP-binding protein, partial [Candidatus Roizmanbacteria bacterium CG_4_9_14_0_2_um_filter_39_13]
MATSTIPILFDKTHLTSIGERLYTQSLDLVRELVANAYDADATRVNIVAETDRIVVEDNGTGMDRAGIEQYFTIGSRFKKSYPTSRTYHRTRIGEFGIGKFAVLSLCDRFELYTRTETYAATVIFDKEDFEKREKWEVPIIEHEIGGSSKETGTRVVLYDIKKRLEVYDMDRYLTSTFPLTEPDFSLFLNERKLEPKYIVGERVTINHSSTFGKMKGEIILASLTIPRELTGIGVRVKGILVQRSTFELDQKHELMMRKITGEIRADFLPITTDRGGFIKDSPEYQYFMSFMQKKLQQVIKKLEKRSLAYSDTKSEKLLSDVLS